MDYNRIGKSGLKISHICLGSNNFGSQLNEQDSIKIIKKAIDLGINIIDSADTYTEGKSEQIIGKAIQGYRDDLVIATKVGLGLGPPPVHDPKLIGPNKMGLSRKRLLSQFKHSLESLKTDFVDIYYLHQFDPDTPLEETLRTLNDLVREGKIRYIGCSNFVAWQIAKAHEVCDRYDLEKFIAVEPPYNLLLRDIESDLLPYCQQEELGVLTFSPLGSGFLTGKYSRNAPPPAGSKLGARQLERKNEKDFATVEQLESVAHEVGIPLHKLTLAWILKNPLITAPIIASSKIEQLEENCQITEVKISDNVYKRLNEITEDYVKTYIGWDSTQR
ncbi:MAG: aldo/keto reductase [Candidatus Bathyarchaeota archaeon]